MNRVPLHWMNDKIYYAQGFSGHGVALTGLLERFYRKYGGEKTKEPRHLKDKTQKFS